MRDYSRFSPKFWVGNTGKKLRALGCEHQVLAAYLITSPQANMIGLYYLPVAYMAHETGLSETRCRLALKDIIGIGFCSYDDDAEVVWVHEAVTYQLGDTALKDRQRVGAVKQYESAPQCALLEAFYDRYKDELPLIRCRNNPSQALAKPLPRVVSKKISPTDTSDEQGEQQRARRTATSDERQPTSHSSQGVLLGEFQKQVSNAGVAVQFSPTENTKFSKLVPVAQDEIDHAIGRAVEAKVNSASYVLGVIAKERERASGVANGPAPPPFSPRRQVSKQEAAMINAMKVTEAYNARVEENERPSAEVVRGVLGSAVCDLPQRVDAVVDGGVLVASHASSSRGSG